MTRKYNDEDLPPKQVCHGGIDLSADFKNMDIGFLSDFLKQSQTGNLKTKGLYP